MVSRKEICDYFNGIEVSNEEKKEILLDLENEKTFSFRYGDIIEDCDINKVPKEAREFVRKYKAELFDTYLKKLNDELVTYNLEIVDSNCTIEQLERSITSLFIKIFEEHKHHSLFFSDIVQRMEYLIKTKDPNYHLIKNNKFIAGWYDALVLKGLLKDYNDFIFLDDFKRKYEVYVLIDDWGETGLNIYDNAIVYNHGDLETIKSNYNMIKEDINNWNKSAEIILAPYVHEIMNLSCQLKRKKTNSYVPSFNLEKNIIQYFENFDDVNILICFSQKTGSRYLVLLNKYNFLFAGEYKELDDEPISSIYGVLSPYDDLGNNHYTKETTVDNPLTNLNLRPTSSASVVGRSVVGGLLGGTVGSIAGAASAINHNLKNEMKRNNEMNSASQTLQVKIDRFITNLFMSKSKISITFETNSNDGEKIWDFLNEAQNYDKFMIGEYAKEYLENHDYILNQMSDLDSYVASKIKWEKYWSEHSSERDALNKELEKLENIIEKTSQEIKKLDNQNAPLINKIKEKYNVKLEKEEKLIMLDNEILKLTDDLSKLSLFKIKDRNRLNTIIKEKKQTKNNLEYEIKQQKDEMLKQMNLQIDEIEKEKRDVEDELNHYLDKKQQIINELTKER